MKTTVQVEATPNDLVCWNELVGALDAIGTEIRGTSYLCIP